MHKVELLFVVFFYNLNTHFKALFIDIEISTLLFLLQHDGSKRSFADVEEDTES